MTVVDAGFDMGCQDSEVCVVIIVYGVGLRHMYGDGHLDAACC